MVLALGLGVAEAGTVLSSRSPRTFAVSPFGKPGSCMSQISASPPSFLFSRKATLQSPPLMRSDVLVLAAGILRGIDVAIMPMTALLAYLLRFGSLEIDLSHIVVVPFGMIIIANAMSFVKAYELRELCNLRVQISKVVAGWATSFALLLAIVFFERLLLPGGQQEGGVQATM